MSYLEVYHIITLLSNLFCPYFFLQFSDLLSILVYLFHRRAVLHGGPDTYVMALCHAINYIPLAQLFNIFVAKVYI